MEQIIHIFRKDVRHHWWEIAVALAVVAAYGWKESTAHGVASVYAFGVNTFFLGLLTPLVPIAWALLIVRVVHAESLVGDRQFWVTRPYEWKKLLAAKVLFIVAFINVPLFILQAFLLWKAGFPPTSHLSGLLWLQLLWTLILILPLATLATVTASLGQSILVVLAALLYMIALGVLFASLPNAEASPVPVSIVADALAGIGGAVILWQYARRRTGQSRSVLLGAAAAIPLLMLATPYRRLIARAYPESSAGLPVQLRFDPAKLGSRQGGYPERNKVHLRIPLLVSGITEGFAVFVNGALVSIQAPGGLRWSSNWRATGLSLEADHPRAGLNVTLDRDFFEQVNLVPVSLGISFALEPVRANQKKGIVALPGGFALPGEGRCAPSFTGILCLFPLKTPFLQISARSEELTCPPQENEVPLPAGNIGYEWMGRGSAGLADAGLNPVPSDGLVLWEWGEVGSRKFGSRNVCPGTPLTVFSGWEVSQHARAELDIEGIRLTDYQLNDSPAGGTGFGVAVP